MGRQTTFTTPKLELPFSLVGKGIYPIPVAARLSKVSQRRIRYWLKRLDSEDAREGRRLWQGEHQPIDSKIVLGFLDLQEVRFIQAFLNKGVSWKVLRAAHEVASERYKTEHPFCTRIFATDGKHILEELKTAADRTEYEEIAKSQTVFPEVVKPFIKDLEFSADQRLLRWWPLSKTRSVVLDPNRLFGQPIVSDAGVSTEILYLAVKGGECERNVANWYEVRESEVRDAIDFEEWLAAA
jgi:uncharacterized protein (DUF433 family)/DNA-binding transcriptional MerR regulator